MDMMRRSSSTLNRLSFTINHLPEALLIEIFLRLPLNSAKLCMVVCKHWYALISTSNFGNRFLQLNYASTLLISYEHSWQRNNKLFVSSENGIFRSHLFSLACLPCGPIAVVVASCGDLLLCRSDFDYFVYYICNPLTKKWIQLPPTPSLHDDTVEWQTGFIFQGLGISFKYAVARVSSFNGGSWDDIKFEIFTSDSGKWSEKVWNWNWNLENLAGIPYEGMLCWISYHAPDDSDILVGVDPFSEGEPLHFTALPPRPKNIVVVRRLAVCRGILKLLETEMDGSKDALSLRLWDLKDFGKNEWDLKHHITFFGLQYKNPSWFNYRWPGICPISCDSKNDCNVMYIVIEGRVVLSCNMNKQTLDVIHDRKHHMFINGGGSFIYVLPWQPTAIPYLSNAETVS